jgi:hypothetical protein
MMAAATNPNATPIKGLSTANQKETFHADSSGGEFLFMLFFQAPEGRNFTETWSFFRDALSAAWAIRVMMSCYQPTTHAQRYAAIRQTSGLSIVNPTAILETNGPVNFLSVEIDARSKRNFQRPESNCGVAINSICGPFMIVINKRPKCLRRVVC